MGLPSGAIIVGYPITEKQLQAFLKAHETVKPPRSTPLVERGTQVLRQLFSEAKGYKVVDIYSRSEQGERQYVLVVNEVYVEESQLSDAAGLVETEEHKELARKLGISSRFSVGLTY